ncbi:metalloprotein [Methanoplanus limicola]|uniref:Proteasome Rpn11 subunit JAMM motif n=1 Tax=Methanoplanus limicola DSM 2279 TaxID=937775 RepID=H1YXN2_9EURY|nr:metalloprotein [Methanoplanus limicola]EHQ35001.1 proteasome Rpn11 subunit JAMM motif [Methanoplanus limicola DSM 2279]
MPDIKIKMELIKTLLALGKSQHPDEFLALLKVNNGVIDEFELAPGTITGRTSASFSQYMLPLSTNNAGSAHSHPSGALRPSDADLRFFPASGRWHIIVGPPYDLTSWRCFRADGRIAEPEVIS